jgi:hypothetical protein
VQSKRRREEQGPRATASLQAPGELEICALQTGPAEVKPFPGLAQAAARRETCLRPP